MIKTARVFIVRILLLLSAMPFLLDGSVALSAEDELVPLEGISVGMKKKRLLDNWGFPQKRDHKIHKADWFYLNTNTNNPTDGVVVYMKKNKVAGWKIVNNIYAEMRIWGQGAGPKQ